MKNIFYVLLLGVIIFIILFIVQVIVRSEKPFSDTFKHMFAGTIALLIVNLSSGITGFFLPINLLSLGISAIAGTPGVSMLIILNTILS